MKSRVDLYEPPRWHLQAACAGILTFLNWPLDNTKQVCEGCPVQARCRAAGMMPYQIRMGVETVERMHLEGLFACGHRRVLSNTVNPAAKWRARVCRTCELVKAE